MKCKLNAKFVATIKLQLDESDELFWDTQQQGLALRVRRSADGTLMRTWVCQRKRHGKLFRIKIGRAAEIGIDQARDAARKLLAKVDLGEDPAAERRAAAAKNEHKMSALVSEYLERKKREVRASTLSEVTRYLQSGDHFKALHNLPIHEIDRGRVSRCVETVERERGAPTAREARQCLSAFFSWAMQMGHAESNPVIASIQPSQIKPRDHVLTDAELAAIWKACNGDDAGRIVKLLVLTGCRRSEVGGMAWSELDLERGTWTVPGARTKNERQHMLPVTPAMRQVIDGVPRVVNRDPLFGTRCVGGYSAWGEGKKVLDQRLGDSVRPWRLHDIRRSVATKMADIGVQPHIIEAILNHQSGHRAGVAGIYNRSPYEREVRAALATWHDHLRSLVEGGKRKVVPFKTA